VLFCNACLFVYMLTGLKESWSQEVYYKGIYITCFREGTCHHTLLFRLLCNADIVMPGQYLVHGVPVRKRGRGRPRSKSVADPAQPERRVQVPIQLLNPSAGPWFSCLHSNTCFCKWIGSRVTSQLRYVHQEIRGHLKPLLSVCRHPSPYRLHLSCRVLLKAGGVLQGNKRRSCWRSLRRLKRSEE